VSVVVGYVPTPEGVAAFEHALQEAVKRLTRLVVVNTSRGDALVDQRYAATEQLDELESRLVEAEVEHLLVHSIRGRDAADEILAAAGEHRAELIVLGLRRRSPVGKLIMGSTAQRVLLDARCPVLAVKAAPVQGL
jgi:nucleotide-binding universal stress UspA family protein